MTAEELKSISTAELVEELRKRFTEVQEAQKLLGLGTTAAPASTTKRARHFSGTTMSAAAVERWKGWKDYRAKHPGAKPKDFFKAKAAGKV